MQVSEMGEFGLIDRLAEMVAASSDEKLATWRQLVIGIGDDTAVWQGDTSLQLLTTDTLTQDVNFTLDMTTWWELGWKALAVNLSDIAAMGGIPRYALVSLSLPGDTEADDVTALYEGMIEIARKFGVAIVGGNVSRAPMVSITVTVHGIAGRNMLTRSKARTGDKVAVTGNPGTAAAGLKMLIERLNFNTDTAELLRNTFLKPLPRVAEGQMLVERGVAAAIDISDGLVADLSHVCKASRVGARVEIDRLPIHPAVRDNFGDSAAGLALSGGEDYELLFTAQEEIVTGIIKAASCPVTVIGEIMAEKPGEVTLIDITGKQLDLLRAGWDHFTVK
jgi:thiamine-monophosphate kinase